MAAVDALFEEACVVDEETQQCAESKSTEERKEIELLLKKKFRPQALFKNPRFEDEDFASHPVLYLDLNFTCNSYNEGSQKLAKKMALLAADHSYLRAVIDSNFEQQPRSVQWKLMKTT
uniref:Uncharacterized protein n=1 Tax=Ditylenchus dipsaci TaxID=166011 RepID=A0A915D4U8_9BILA